MREIKFRLWSKIAQSMIEWDLVKEKPHTIFDNGNYITMQYTGLKDKNGIEIYEGDTVKWKDYDNPKQILYRQGTPFLKDFDVIYALYSLCNDIFFDKCKDVEIIGNIHEDINK